MGRAGSGRWPRTPDAAHADDPESGLSTWLAGSPGVDVLQNDYPAVITVGASSYPSVTHAYWALSTPDPHWHDQIAAAPRGYDAAKLALQASRRADWASARLAVMAVLLRAKYTQHPRMAETLLASGDARIVYVDFDSAYWSVGSERATNWIGRLLEVIRSELAAAEAGIPLPAVHGNGASSSPRTPGPTSEDGEPGLSGSP
ncbi:NADAR family protein [Micromonospora aurantiaca]|uniref:NADAR family protein n=1 Tax=Micromonospora aurantiaca (nom. illeg.) TaxID=47850 RepID=UPI00378FA49B